MTFEIALVLAVIVVVFILLATEVIPPDLVALGTLVCVTLVGLITPAEAFQSFANEAPITVAAMFILSYALQRTGAIDELGAKLRRMPRMSEGKVLIAMMIPVAAVSAFLNNTPVVISFLPLVLGLARHHQISASKMLIPLSFAAIFGGTCTLIGTSTNLAVSGLVSAKYGIEIGLFDITLPGLILAAAGIAYMTLIGRHLLPKREPLATLVDEPAGRQYFAEVEVGAKSKWAGRLLRDTGLPSRPNLVVREIRRGAQTLSGDQSETVLEPGDRIVIGCSLNTLLDLQIDRHLVVHNARTVEGADSQNGEAHVVELMVMHTSPLIGRSLEEIEFYEKSCAEVLAIHRRGERLGGTVGKIRLRFADTLLVKIPRQNLAALRESRDVMVLSDLPVTSRRRNRKPLVIGTFAAMVGLAATGAFPISILAVTAVIFLTITRCIDVTEMYGAIEWRTVSMIIGMIALGAAVEKTGTAKWAAEATFGLLENPHPILILAIVYLVTTTLTELISNNAVAILMTPVAMEAAIAYELSPLPFVIAIMFAASASFATPIGYQTNTFVYGAGGYAFRDFLRVGIPLNLVFWIMATAVIPLFYPF